MQVIGVRFKKAGKVYYFNPEDHVVAEGDGVIVETARGVEFGEVAGIGIEADEELLGTPIKPIMRIATQEDREIVSQNADKEREAFSICEQKITEHQLDMKLVDVDFTFNAGKITFYFTSDGRVDFRELVRDLAGIFKTRIELRQIGVRDEAKLLGGLGACGRVVCCKAFLGDFHPVSIKMAKEQSLSLSPTKISGLCGRLMCCLKYEQDCYETTRKMMPKVGREVMTPDGPATVFENRIIAERVKVRITLQDGTPDLREYTIEDISPITDKHADTSRVEEEEAE